MLIVVLYLLILGLIAFAVFQYTEWYRRQRVKATRKHPPAGFQMTDEVSIDPTTGVHQRVWYNPATGERWYENL